MHSFISLYLQFLYNKTIQVSLSHTNLFNVLLFSCVHLYNYHNYTWNCSFYISVVVLSVCVCMCVYILLVNYENDCGHQYLFTWRFLFKKMFFGLCPFSNHSAKYPIQKLWWFNWSIAPSTGHNENYSVYTLYHKKLIQSILCYAMSK